MSELEVLLKFKKTLVAFIDELIATLPQEGDLVIIRIFLNDQVSIKTVIDNFIIKLNFIPEQNNPNKVNIQKLLKDRNEYVLLENNLFFADLGKDKINHFKKIWRSDRLDQEDRKVIWKWVDSLIDQSEKYKKILIKN
jgi:hypothetical protein